MSAANSLMFDKSSLRLFMYIRSRSGPNVEPWGTHASRSAKEEASPLSDSFKKINNKFKML